MSYSIYIGNAAIKCDEEDLHAYYAVEEVSLPDAPQWPNPTFSRGSQVTSFGDISGDTNGRHPGYSSMANWARDVGLYDLFLGEDGQPGLLHPHPGCQRLTPEIVAEVSGARARWEAMHPDAKPGWRDGEDSSLAKLIWYEWWMKWALKNCQIPAIENL